jgi:hypothetical protein
MHDQITERLSEYIDGELTARERAMVDEHLADCAACRTVLDELRGIVLAATRLPVTRPETELWTGIEQRVAASDVARTSRFVPRPSRRFSFTAPQLVAAGIALMFLSGGAVYLTRPQQVPLPAVMASGDSGSGPNAMLVRLADPQYDGAVADLERTLELGRKQLDPETVRILELNLGAIDAAIEQCQQALEADPANAFLSNHLVSARQRKLALLRRATALTTGS